MSKKEASWGENEANESASRVTLAIMAARLIKQAAHGFQFRQHGVPIRFNLFGQSAQEEEIVPGR